MVPPSVVIKNCMGGRRFARSFSRSAATERLVNAIFVVINSELFQLALQVDCVPDHHVIKKLPSYCPDQPFHERMDRGAYGTDLISSTSSMRKLASQRWKRNNGSWSALRCRGSDFPAMI